MNEATRRIALMVTLCASFASAGRSQDAGGGPALVPDVLEGGRSRSRVLVIALHGGSWSGHSPRHLAERLRDELDAPVRRQGMRLLVPVAPALEQGRTWQVPWVQPAGEAAVLSLLQQELAADRVLPDRVSLAGHGAGATGALTVAARHPDLFAAVAAWSGTPSPVWGPDGRVVDLLDDPAEGLWRVPVYLWTGTDDEHIDRDTLRLFVNRLRNAAEQRGGPGLTWEQGPGGHGYGPRGPEPGLVFLKGRRKQQRR
ncbi:MAG: alpha/beta hydrolase-fold protein [Planctomycetota bacterium]|jgi:poly(3-hydroxybutyrate) depolymerase